MFFRRCLLIPMVIIILIALLSVAPHVKTYHILMTLGLIICAIGDYTLQWFVVGLSFFLLGHVFYISAFLKTKERKPPTALLIGLLVYGVIMAGIITGGLLKDGDIIMGIAVLAYICVIMTMGLTAWRTNCIFAIIGSLLFIVSDSILALNKFTVSIPYAGVYIMVTYYAAQLLLALSISKYSVIRNKVVQ